MIVRAILLLAVSIWCLQPQPVLSETVKAIANPTREQFQSYWYPNGAEISRYRLEQARYGDIHSGDAVLIFVTESMDSKLQVKADRPDSHDIPILKLNATRKFYTGIYPYSVLTSIFAPVDAQQYVLPLKISTSVQEWCGHVYAQMNLRDDKYIVESHSYFEKEADGRFSLDDIIPEDAIWTKIRIAPNTLPLGNFLMIPGMVYARLLHRPLAPLKVKGSLSSEDGKSLEGKALMQYRLEYSENRRVLKIFFEKEFPYRIQGWEDIHRSLPGMGAKILTTRAWRTHTIMIDYWNRHGNRDRRLLKKLGLTDGR